MSMSVSGGKSAPAVKVAIVSVALSIIIMLMAVGIVQGFRMEIRDRVTGFDSHITLLPETDEYTQTTTIDFTPGLDSLLMAQPGVRSVDLTASTPILLKTRGAFKGLYLRGVPHDYDFGFLQSSLTEGNVPRFNPDSAKSDKILLSKATASKLSLSAGDTVNAYLVADEIRARPLVVSGIFDTHFDAYDNYYAYGDLRLVQKLTHIGSNEGSSIEIDTDNFDRIPHTAQQIIDALDHAIDNESVNQGFSISTTLEKGANYFAWLDLLDTNVWVILTLMTLVAAFTLISGMLIIILEKVQFIGVMKAIGTSRRQIRRIFVLLAIRIGLTGLLAGNAIALILMLAQHYLRIIPLNPSAYYIDFVPVCISPAAILSINAGFIAVIYLVLILPSQLAGRIRPAESMRFEQ